MTETDFFISYNRADEDWAKWIAWQLEDQGLTTVIQAWDFRPGSNFVLEMDRAAKEARRVLAVLSPTYLTSSYTAPEWAAFFRQDPTGSGRRLLPVRVRDGDVEGLLGSIVYVDLVGLDEPAAREALLAGLAEDRAKPLSAPRFPGPAATAKRPGAPSFPGGPRPAGPWRKLRWMGLLLAFLGLLGLLAYGLQARPLHAVLLVPGPGVFGFLPTATDRPAKPGEPVCSLRIHVGRHLYTLPDLRRQPVFLGGPAAQLELLARSATNVQWVKQVAASTSTPLSAEEQKILAYLSWEMPRIQGTRRFQGGEEIAIELVRGESPTPLGSYRVHREPGVQPILLVGQIPGEQP